MSSVETGSFWEGILEEQLEELDVEDDTGEEYRKGECPHCRKIFADDYILLNHLCKEKLTEY